MSEITELILSPDAAMRAFADADGAAAIVSEIRRLAYEVPVDVSTTSGRKHIASTAFKIAKSKVYLDDYGKGLVEEQKKEIKKVDEVRKSIRDHLDAIKDEYRQPLTDFEEREKSRIAAMEKRLADMRGPALRQGSAALRVQLSEIEAVDLSAETWAEYHSLAVTAQASGAAIVRQALVATEKAEAEAAELARLRQEAAEREAKDREARRIRDIEDRARREAEAAVQVELAVERRRAESAEADKRQAEDAHRQAEQRASAEVSRLAMLKAEQDRIDAARAADVEHRREVNRTVVANMVDSLGVPMSHAQAIVRALALHKIPHCTINY